MFSTIQSALKVRSLLVFLMVHVGLALGIFALARSSYGEWDLTSSLFLATILLLYGGFILSILFIVLPLLPWLKKAQQVEHWSDRLVRDLPIFIEHAPKIIAIVQNAIVTWKEATKAKND